MNLNELNIYSIAIKLRKEIYSEVDRMPFSWSNKDIQQIKRSASSIPANIAEGFGRRFYPKDFNRFLTISLGSSDETKNHIQTLSEIGFFNKERADYFLKKYKDLSIRIINLITAIRKKNNL